MDGMRHIILVIIFAGIHGFTMSQFQDFASTVGIDHIYQGTAPGAGVSFIDVNQDGWDDITLADLNGIHYYQNQNGTFEKVDLQIFFEGEVKQILWADYDNDGDFDLFVSGFEASNRLFQNIGDLEFVDSTQPAGLPTREKRHFGACFGDYNRDGFLDLYYTERKLVGEQTKNQNLLFVNQKDGTFKDLTRTTRTADFDKLPFCASFVDVNRDLWPDIYIANDKDRGNTLLINMANGTFADQSDESSSGLKMSAMSVTPGDYNQDGWSDIYISNIAVGNALLQNQGLLNEDDPLSVYFEEVAAASGTGFYDIGWGAQFLDGDNDGDIDLYVSGMTIGSESPSSSYFINLGNGAFDVESEGFIGDTVRSFSNAVGDFNRDGTPDIAVQNHAPFSFQLWSQPSSGNFIEVSLVGVQSNTQGVGSLIEVYFDNQYQSKYSTCGSGFLGQNSQHHIFGIGTSEKVDSIMIHWPSGHVDMIEDVAQGERIEIIEGSSTNGEITIDSAVLAFGATQFIKTWDAAEIDHVVRHKSFMGGGAAFFDYDADGDDDLYITGGTDIDYLYRNQNDGTFELVSYEAGLSITDQYYTLGVVTGDIDNDGFRDIFVTTWSSDSSSLAKNLLFHNQGDGTFTEIWSQETEKDTVFSIGALFLDYDLDGFLDLYVINYVAEVKFIYDDQNQIIGYDHTCFENTLYKNNGDLSFSYIDQANDTGCALAVTGTDYDGDGDQDIYIANDFGAFIQPNKLYQNDYPVQSFTNVGESTNSDLAIYGMGIAIGDIDYDLDFDYYITNFGRNVLLENQDGVFSDITDQAGVTDTWAVQDESMNVGWGTAFLDADNDMDLDLYVSNGYVPSPSFLNTDLYTFDKLYYNDGTGHFEEQNASSGIDNRFTSRGMAYSDFDNDGDVDILSVVLNVPVGVTLWNSHLFENTLEDQNWVEVRLEGTSVNRDAFGSKVIVYAGGLAQIRELNGGASHCSQHSSTLHFGLSDISMIDSIEVHWTGGKHIQKLYEISANQILDIKQDMTTSTIGNNSNFVSKIRIYPNPSSGNLIMIESTYGEAIQNVEVFDTHGRSIDSQLIRASQEKNYVRFNDNIQPGIYMLRMRIQGQSVNKKIIIQ